ncbi:hypothetical protein CRUP_008562 [Coryphaenoides rupestris]|nr:hypothetical protein CRUP_008562 [Coryphaenoides rupestris]
MRGGEHRTTMKKIYIGKTALKVSRNGAKHQKKSEFDSTRQYLETELRRAQEELDKFTDKLRRIQSSYSALQRINQDLEEKIHRNNASVSREIIALNNHLIEAKLTIEKLEGTTARGEQVLVGRLVGRVFQYCVAKTKMKLNLQKHSFLNATVQSSSSGSLVVVVVVVGGEMGQGYSR